MIKHEAMMTEISRAVRAALEVVGLERIRKEEFFGTSQGRAPSSGVSAVVLDNDLRSLTRSRRAA